MHYQDLYAARRAVARLVTSCLDKQASTSEKELLADLATLNAEASLLDHQIASYEAESLLAWRAEQAEGETSP